MGATYYIFLIVFGVIGLVAILVKMNRENKMSLLDEMFENNDIDISTYKKYKKKI